LLVRRHSLKIEAKKRAERDKKRKAELERIRQEKEQFGRDMEVIE
jgi:hypothetical protein